MATMRAYVSVQPVKNVAGLKDYLELGRGSMKEAHLDLDTNRYAAMYCDASSPEAFVAEAQRIAKEHSRANQAYSLIVSPPEGSYAKDDDIDMSRMVADAVEGGRRAYPNTKLYAVAHNDSEGSHGCGGKPHVHLVVMNHDIETGKAITANRTAVKVRAIFNELGTELGWTETEVTHDRAKNAVFSEPTPVDTSKDDAQLAATRERLATLGEFELNLFDDVMRAKAAATGEDYVEWQKSFRAELSKDGITMEFVKGRRGPHQKKASNSKETQGVVYRRKNPATGRVRGMKASDMGEQVKVSALRQASRDYLAVQRAMAAPSVEVPESAVIAQTRADDIDVEAAMRASLAEMFVKTPLPTFDDEAYAAKIEEEFETGLNRRLGRDETPQPAPVPVEVVEPEVVEVAPEPEPAEPETTEVPTPADEVEPVEGEQTEAVEPVDDEPAPVEVIDGVSYKDAEAWYQDKIREYDELGRQIETAEAADRERHEKNRQRAMREIAQYDNLYTTTKKAKGVPAARRAVMQHVAKDRKAIARIQAMLHAQIGTPSVVDPKKSSTTDNPDA